MIVRQTPCMSRYPNIASIAPKVPEGKELGTNPPMQCNLNLGLLEVLEQSTSIPRIWLSVTLFHLTLACVRKVISKIPGGYNFKLNITAWACRKEPLGRINAQTGYPAAFEDLSACVSACLSVCVSVCVGRECVCLHLTPFCWAFWYFITILWLWTYFWMSVLLPFEPTSSW